MCNKNNYKIMEKNKEFFEKLLKAKSPSGYEEEATKVFNDYCSEFSKKSYEDNIGNSGFVLSGDIKNGNYKTIMISGHIDQIGAQVSYINDHGLLSFIALGGLDKKTLPGARLKVKSINGDWIDGVIQKKPIHVETPDERDEVIKIKEMTINIGCETKEEAEKLVEIGSPVVFADEPIMNFGKNWICSSGLDDKVGVYITAEVLKNLSTETDSLENKEIYGVSCTQEEEGLRGATVCPKRINPDISIDIDVTFSTDEQDIDKAIYGDIKLGKGPVISIGPDKNKKLVELAKKVARENNIPIQFESSFCGGTNTSAIQENSVDCMTCLISIPNTSMHTQVEVCDWRDIEGAIKLITEMVKSL